MATWTDNEKRVWTFEDGKLNFQAWIESDPIREAEWVDACDAHLKGLTDIAGKIFQTWIDYADAVWEDAPELPGN